MITGLGIASICLNLCHAVSAAAVQHSGTTQNQSKANPNRPMLRPRSTCPKQVEPLVTTLLRDLPQYMNRIHLRKVQRRFETASWNYAIIASAPDFNPLPLEPVSYKNSEDKNLHQVFFTMLERQYSGKNVVEWQQYHWLFLSHTESGWRLAILLSRLGPYPEDRTKPITPIQESTQGLTAEAIRTWLRDCQAGSVKLPST
jgi:hypothetical protein